MTIMIALARRDAVRQFWIAAGLSLFAALAFYFSTNATLRDLDYTSEIASALLRGHLGLREKPPEWLNEMIPHGDRYYSAFPLGAVLSMLPIALLQKAGLIHDFPGHVLAALIASLCVYFFFQLAKAFGADYSSPRRTSLARRILMALFPISILVTSTFQKCMRNPGTRMGCSRSRRFRGTSTRCCFKGSRAFNTSLTSNQTGSAAQSSLPVRFFACFFAGAADTR